MGKKQHYIPQFYLRSFSDNNQKSIGLYRFEDKKFVSNASIKDIAYRNNFYDNDNSIENVLTNMEGRWNEILKVLLGRDMTANTNKWVVENRNEITNDIICFFAITQVRSAQQGDSIVKIMRTIEKSTRKEISSETYNQYFGCMPEMEKHPGSSCLNLGLEVRPLFAGLNLVSIYNFSKEKFITSDVPVFCINPFFEKRQYSFNFGLASMGIQIFLPISVEVCLCLYDKNIYINKYKNAIFPTTSRHIIHQINQLTVQNAYEQVFFIIGESEEYIKDLCQHRKSSDNHSRVRFWDDKLIEAYQESIHSSFLLPCFRIKKSSMRMSLSEKSVRPEVQDLCDMRNNSILNMKK